MIVDAAAAVVVGHTNAQQHRSAFFVHPAVGNRFANEVFFPLEERKTFYFVPLLLKPGF